MRIEIEVTARKCSAGGTRNRDVCPCQAIHLTVEEMIVAQANRVGEENAGWECARYLLEFERGAGIFSPRLRSQLKRVGDVMQTQQA